MNKTTRLRPLTRRQDPASASRSPEDDPGKTPQQHASQAQAPSGQGQEAERGAWEERPLAPRLSENEAALRELFCDCSDVVFRKVRVPDTEWLIVYIDGLVKTDDLHMHALYPLLFEDPEHPDVVRSLDTVLQMGLSVSQVLEVHTLGEAVERILSAHAVLLMDGQTKGLALNIVNTNRRQVAEPLSETVIRGPREGFTEVLRTNTALLRQRIRTPNLKMVPFTIGTQTRTQVVLAYIEGLADKKVIAEVTQRLKNIRLDAVLESGYLEELLRDSPRSPFPQMQYSERPDTVAAQLLEGRFAVFTDGTPFVLTGPITFWQMLQSSEDYYEQFWMSNAIRWLRFGFFLIALLLPAFYIATITYHQDMIPTSLVLTVAAARETIPFPALIEALIMEISFEALREASIRLPRTVGQAVSILGALVIGQAAVQAGIVSAPMVIVVALTGIASFTIPKFNAAITIRMLRFPLMLLAAVLGLFGIVLGVFWIAVHLCSLRSFGVPYLAGVAPYRPGELKDILVRAPWWHMDARPWSYAKANRRRMPDGLRPSPRR
ncbi:putative membrane protein YfkQ [Alicyclobacillus cellulosilyticus]|uniref:Membrane protein YfkQ n=1 Tax=Alicyclobacillus cellulosilyticus TaxID=1003997 RepID=A0A917K6I4_9BACL|nr:spore germination protein [Alicyclobacillus cellulosilyticus]GGI99759.1 putative membrane protein YfkQ [Alicyclobacillus cellulosilyticus]